jgi:hypothetical protein
MELLRCRHGAGLGIGLGCAVLGAGLVVWKGLVWDRAGHCAGLGWACGWDLLDKCLSLAEHVV